MGTGFVSSEGYIPTQYRVRFSYLVNGKKYEGSYGADSLQQAGQTFEILYDPKYPNKNTGSDFLSRSWAKWVVGGFSIAAWLIAKWLWGNQDWFKNQ
jgi:hypothetical protein